MTLMAHGRLGDRRFSQVIDPDTGRPALFICLECRAELEADAGTFEKHDCLNYRKMPRPRVKRDRAVLEDEITAPESAEDLAGSYVRNLEQRLALVDDAEMIQEARDQDSRPTALPLYEARLAELEEDEATTNDEEN